MKRILLLLCLVILSSLYGQSNDWMTSLDAAKRLALVQDKMILMTWEESTLLPLPVTIKDTNGKLVFVENLFKNEYLINLLREHFILVKVNESVYQSMIDDLKGKHSSAYINKFNDDSIKVMDANGTIINTKISYREYINITHFIQKYAINTSFIKAELMSYAHYQNFTTSFRLSTKYLEMASYILSESREEFVKTSALYLKEAEEFLAKETIDNKEAFQQKIELQRLQQELVLGNPRKTLRKLKRLDPLEINTINNSLVSFLYFTSYIMIKDETNASTYRSKISKADLKRANAIINTYLNI